MKWFVVSLIASAMLSMVGCSQAVRFMQGTEKGQCYGNQSCNAGLKCSSSNICVPSSEEGSGGNGSGGETGTGGTSATGGTSGSGGVSDSGGSQGSGGVTSTGGQDSGGSSGSGGTSNAGGAQSNGGSSATGGSSGSGGATTPSTNLCNATAGNNAVAFCNGQALGAMTGWGWVALGSADAITNPTCDTAKATITSTASCLANTNWNKPNALCMSGSVPALAAVDPDYTGNWGVQVGVNAKDPNAGIGTSWKSVTITVTGTPASGLRAVLHKSGEAESAGYCAPMTSGTAVSITDFNSKCWDGTGDDLTESDSANIDKIGVQVTSTATAAQVTDLCMTKIELGN